MNGRIRVAVVGCGKVARGARLPVLAGHPGVEVVALVDPDVERARALARDYAVDRILESTDALRPGDVDAAFVCTPPSEHARIAVSLARRGIHVMVEKPIAVTAAEARTMVDAAESANVVLAVALYRRLLPSTRLARAMVRSGWLGRPLRVDHREGDTYGWTAATLSSMRRDLSGGGVLIDCGSHALDQIAYVLGADAELVEYRDNDLGGVESDCVVRVGYRIGERTIDGTVELSRTRRLRNTLEVVCERGTIALDPSDRNRIGILPVGLELRDGPSESVRPFELSLGWAGAHDEHVLEPYRVETDDFLTAIRSGAAPELAGRTALPTLSLIDACYAGKKRLEEPGMPDVSAERVAAERSPISAGKGRLLLTGATGFLGCRFAEVAALGLDWTVRALVHDTGHASRLARLPVEMVAGDLRSDADVRRLVGGCDAVVHCAVGTNGAPRADFFDVTVEGTRRLAEAARAEGVGRLVHVSSIAAYGLVPGMSIDESTPLRPAAGDDYAEGKAAAERVVRDAVERGLSAVIVRPTRMYGPFARDHVVGPLEKLATGKLAVRRSALGAPSQTVFVDDVVAAVGRALRAPPEVVSGKAFVIGDDQDVSCDAFYRFFAEASGLPLPVADDRSDGSSNDVESGGERWWSTMLEVASSTEFVELANRVLRTGSTGRALRQFLDSNPLVRKAARRLTGLEPVVYERVGPSPAPAEIIEPREAAISLVATERILGHRPVVPRREAMQRTLEWARYARILPEPPPRSV